jgi:hypothetical protein
VVFNNHSGGHQEFVSAEAGRGRCRKSENSDPVAVCQIETIAPGESVAVTITVKLGSDLSIDYRGSVKLKTMNFVRARERDPNPGNNFLDAESTTIRR